MEQNIRNIPLISLRSEWGRFVSTFTAKTTNEQGEYLLAQGYSSLGDLLAHVTAWWRRGMQIVDALLEDPDFVSPQVNVDAFNAASVSEAARKDEALNVAEFERARQEFMRKVMELPDEAFNNPQIVRQFSMDVMGHYQEHRF